MTENNGKTPPRGKRGRISTVEAHPQRAEIELNLANGTTLDALSKRFGVHRDALWRHKKHMTPERLSMLRYAVGAPLFDVEKLKQDRADSLSERIAYACAELLHAYHLYSDADDRPNALRAMKEYRQFTELEAQFLGELIKAQPNVNIQIVQSPQYRRLVAMVAAWIGDDPDKRRELAEFIERQEQEFPLIEAKPNGAGSYAA